MRILVAIIIMASLGLVACSRGTAPTEVPPTAATCPRAEVAPWANEAGNLIEETANIGDRYNAAAETGDVSYVRATSDSLESETSSLLSRFNDLHEPPCATEVASTISLLITNIRKGLGAAKDGHFDETTKYFNEYNRLLDVAFAQLEQLQRKMD
jgi:hypothetical protein